jgi:GT2 family glycosyltransferase
VTGSARVVEERRVALGVSFVLPVHDGARWLDDVLAGIRAQDDGRPMEVIAVDDGSTDGSAAILRRHASRYGIRVLAGEGRGAAAAINLGVRHAVHPVICQVDQDVILRPGWMAALVGILAGDGTVGAAQGYYLTPADGTVWARASGLDLEQRYAAIRGPEIDHVCTGNSAYRADALRRAGPFDEALGYGLDNDMSYRLAAAGYRLAFCRDARSVHRWRETGLGYLRQQYGLAYGRFDLIRKHRRRLTGDDVSGLGMAAHVAGMLLVVGGAAAALVLAARDGPWRLAAGLSLGLLAVLAGERLVAGLRAARAFRDAAGLWFVPIHLLRDLAWVAALAAWVVRRGLRRPLSPLDSMPRPRPASTSR